MNKIRLSTKLEAVLAVILLGLVTVASVSSVPRTISDTLDNADTFIRNSNGKYWSGVTEDNIRKAIWDLDNKSGWVKLPPPSVTNSRINDGPDITSTILLGIGCVLDCSDNWFDVKVGKYENVFEMNLGSTLKNVHINAKPYYVALAQDWEGAGVFVNGSRHFKWEFGGETHTYCTVENIWVECDYDDEPPTVSNGTGLYLSCETAYDEIQGGVFRGINTRDCKYGIKIIVTGGSGSNVNQNHFINCKSWTDEYAIYMEQATGTNEIAYNYFERCQYQCDADDSGDSPDDGIVVISGPGNRFEKYMFWDVNFMSPDTACLVQVKSNAENTFFEASGALLVDNSTGNPTLGEDNIIDNGIDNVFFIIGYSDFFVDTLEARHVDINEILQLDKQTSVPSPVEDGTVCYADGTSWDPGSGEGIYAYYNGGWHKLG